MANKKSSDERRDTSLQGAAMDTVEYWANRRPDMTITGFSARLGHDCLITVRGVDADGTPMVAFVGGISLGGAMMKLADAIREEGLAWRLDEYKIKNFAASTPKK